MDDPPVGLVYPLPYHHERDGGTGAGDPFDGIAGGFYEHYRIGRHHEPDGTDAEPTDGGRELKEAYEPPHSPFGRIYALVSSGAFTYDEVMRKIPWCVVLTMISDIGRTRKKEENEKEDIIQTEEEELAFLGLA